MSNDDFLGRPREPELDQYGVPVQPKPAKATGWMVACMALAIVPLVTCISEVKYAHNHLMVASGMPRDIALASALLGVVLLISAKRAVVDYHVSGWIRALYRLSIRITLLST